MKKTRFALLVLCAFVATLFLSACGETKTPEIPETSTETATEVITVTDEDVTDKPSADKGSTDESDFEQTETDEAEMETVTETGLTGSDSETDESSAEETEAETDSTPQTTEPESTTSKQETVSTQTEEKSTETNDAETTDDTESTETTETTVVTPPPPPVIPEKISVVEPSKTMIATIKTRFFNLVNEERARCGVSPLAQNDVLNRAADLRAIECFELFSHTRPNGESCFSLLEEGEYQYDYCTVGENITKTTNFGSNFITEDRIFIGTDAQLTEIAEHLFQNFKNSPPHYSSMISEQFEEIGIGIATIADKNSNILHITCCNFFGTQF